MLVRSLTCIFILCVFGCSADTTRQPTVDASALEEVASPVVSAVMGAEVVSAFDYQAELDKHVGKVILVDMWATW